MSLWYEIKNKDDVELSEDGTEVDVLFNSDGFGNQYISIPVEFLVELLCGEREA